MANYRYLGYGITNEQGIATLDHDSNGNPITHSYTGTGAGELDIIASLDDSTKISESSIQSVPYELWDTICYDTGTDSTHSCWVDNSNIELTRSETGTTVLNKISSNVYLYANDGTTGDYDFTPAFCIEFDFELLTPNANCQIQLFDSSNNNFTTWITTAGHYKIKVNETNVEWWIGTSQQTGKTVALGNSFVRFLMQGNNSFKFSNFKIYSI